MAGRHSLMRTLMNQFSTYARGRRPGRRGGHAGDLLKGAWMPTQPRRVSWTTTLLGWRCGEACEGQRQRGETHGRVPRSPPSCRPALSPTRGERTPCVAGKRERAQNVSGPEWAPLHSGVSSERPIDAQGSLGARSMAIALHPRATPRQGRPPTPSPPPSTLQSEGLLPARFCAHRPRLVHRERLDRPLGQYLVAVCPLRRYPGTPEVTSLKCLREMKTLTAPPSPPGPLTLCPATGVDSPAWLLCRVSSRTRPFLRALGRDHPSACQARSCGGDRAGRGNGEEGPCVVVTRDPRRPAPRATVTKDATIPTVSRRSPRDPRSPPRLQRTVTRPSPRSSRPARVRIFPQGPGRCYGDRWRHASRSCLVSPRVRRRQPLRHKGHPTGPPQREPAAAGAGAAQPAPSAQHAAPPRRFP